MANTVFIPYPSLFVEYLSSDDKYDMHELQYHDGFEIYLQTRGERYFFFHNAFHLLKPGDFCLIRPFELHYSQSQTAEYYGRYVVNFPEDELNLLLSPTEQRQLTRSLATGVYHLDDSQYEQMLSILAGLAVCYKKDFFLANKLQYSYILQMLLLVSNCTSGEGSALPPEQESIIHPDILQAIRYIHRNYQKSLTLDDVTEQVHMSKYYFCRTFRESTGVTFLDYLNSVRLIKAHQMLLETELPLAEIAARTGFSSTLHLSRVFRNTYQVSPSEFRRLRREAQNTAFPEKE